MYERGKISAAELKLLRLNIVHQKYLSRLARGRGHPADEVSHEGRFSAMLLHFVFWSRSICCFALPSQKTKTKCDETSVNTEPNDPTDLWHYVCHVCKLASIDRCHVQETRNPVQTPTHTGRCTR